MFKLITAVVMAYFFLFMWHQFRPVECVSAYGTRYIKGSDVLFGYGLLGLFTVLSYGILEFFVK